MAIFGLGDDGATKTKKKSKASDDTSKKSKKNDDSGSNSQEDEAKALLEKMEAKKDADECPFC